MFKQSFPATVLACAVGAVLSGAVAAEPLEPGLDQPGDSNIILRKVVYDPLAKDNPTVAPVIPYEETESGLFIKNVSGNQTAPMAAAKAKFNAATIYVPAQNAAGDTRYVPYTEDGKEVCDVGVVVPDADGEDDDGVCQVQPIVVTYEEEVAAGSGVSDIFMAVSLDDGATYKRYNLSRTADKSSFTTADGEVIYGDSRKAVQQVKGNLVAVAWTDKYCSAGQPAYAECAVDSETGEPIIGEDGKCEPLYPDFYGVAGSQGSIDYDANDQEPEVQDLGLGEVPFSCVWAARASINKLGYLDPLGKPIIQIYKAERLTSGTRDALQLFMGGAGGGKAGFAVAWHEDPDGLNPGGADGPGAGFSGATTSNQTDVWYSFITGGKFTAIDTEEVIGGDPDSISEDGVPRVRALNPWSLPVRITDNAACNEDNYESPGRAWCNTDFDGDDTADFCADFSDDGKCITQDDRLLNGDTAASRPNLFLQSYTDLEGNVAGAWAILAYEETKGLGEFVPDYCDGSTASDYPECATYYVLFQGKDVYYHSFDFTKPETIAKGLRVNGPAVLQDEDGLPTGELVYVDGDFTNNEATLYESDARYLTENSRRIRFILQGAGAVPNKNPVKDPRTPLIAVWKQGIDGKGGPSDIMLARMVAPQGSLPTDKDYDPSINPYAAENFTCTSYSADDPETCLEGRVQNMSAQTVLLTEDDLSGTGTKVTDWEWTEDNLLDESYENPYDNAIAHRGQIRGNFVVMGFSWTPNWAAARNANDVYNFYVRRSFDGGQTWTTDPNGPPSVQHCERVRTTQQEGADLVCVDIKQKDPEPPRNVSLLKNNSENVAEPRIVSPPGTIKACEKGGVAAPCLPEDQQDKAVVFISYGLSTNLDGNVGEDEEEDTSAPTDMYFARTVDYASTFEYEAFRTDEDDPDDPEVVWSWTPLAKDFQSQYIVEEGEAQLRSTPAGNTFWGVWLGDTTDELKGEPEE